MKYLLLVFLFVLCGMAAAQAADVTVGQSHSNFDVTGLTLQVGDAVIFRNNDNYAHDIEIVNGGETDDRGLQKPGQDIKYTFSKAGVYEIRCALHPKMGMIVTVR